MYLIGKFFINFDHDDGSFTTGEIVARVSTSGYLIRFESDTKIKMPLIMVFSTTMAEICEVCNSPFWMFFESHAEMDAYIKHLRQRSDERDEKVVPLKPKTKH